MGGRRSGWDKRVGTGVEPPPSAVRRYGKYIFAAAAAAVLTLIGLTLLE
jgi:hypothetical protein